VSGQVVSLSAAEAGRSNYIEVCHSDKQENGAHHLCVAYTVSGDFSLQGNTAPDGSVYPVGTVRPITV